MNKTLINIKKILSLLMCLVFIISFTACGDEEKPEETTAGPDYSKEYEFLEGFLKLSSKEDIMTYYRMKQWDFSTDVDQFYTFYGYKQPISFADFTIYIQSASPADRSKGFYNHIAIYYPASENTIEVFKKLENMLGSKYESTSESSYTSETNLFHSYKFNDDIPSVELTSMNYDCKFDYCFENNTPPADKKCFYISSNIVKK